MNEQLSKESADGQGKYDPRTNLRPWPKGTSGNPQGRAPRRTFIAELSGLLSEPVHADELNSKTRMRSLAERILEIAMQGGSVGVKAMGVLLPHVDPMRLRSAIKTSGPVNVLNMMMTGDSEADRDTVRAELDQFILDLPSVLKANGYGPGAVGYAIRAVAARFGGVSAKAGNAMLRQTLDAGMFPVRDGYTLPVVKPTVEDADDGNP